MYAHQFRGPTRSPSIPCPQCRTTMQSQANVGIKCDRCGGYADGQKVIAQGCRNCNFDLCPSCLFRQAGQSHPTPLAIVSCVKGHPLLPQRNVAVNCERCKRFCSGDTPLSVGYGCRVCDFDLCVECVQKHTSPLPPTGASAGTPPPPKANSASVSPGGTPPPQAAHSGVCPRYHALTLFHHTDEWKCNVCGTNYKGFSISGVSCGRCDKCQFDMCSTCNPSCAQADPSCSPFPDDDDVISKRVRCRRGHSLEYTQHVAPLWFCDRCKTQYEAFKISGVGSARCQLCDYDQCFPCVSKIALQQLTNPNYGSAARLDHTATVTWFSVDPRSNQEVAYPPDINQTIEAAYQQHLPLLSITMFGKQFTIDFERKCQLNDRGGGRAICRKDIPTAGICILPSQVLCPPGQSPHPVAPVIALAQQPQNRRYRSLFIGINYPRTSVELRGCINDVRTMMNLVDGLGFDLADRRVLVDEPRFRGRTGEPTRHMIVDSMKWLVKGAKAGDVLFLHYSGHGAEVPDTDGDEADGMDSTMVPADYERAGQITDDEIFDLLCRNLPAGVRLTAIMDCCHSGTLMDLKYVWVPDESNAGQFRPPPPLHRPARRRRDLSGGSEGQCDRGFEVVSSKECAADVVMLSGCKDSQTSADVQQAGMFKHDFGTPGAAGGACTNALAEALWSEAKQANETSMPFVQLLLTMRNSLKRRNFSQIPQVSCSKPLQLDRPFNLSDPL